MELQNAMQQRSSVRAYLKKPVPKEVIYDILNDSIRAISAVNCQPWEFVVAAGQPLEELKKCNLEYFENKEEEDMPPLAIPDGVWKQRRKEIGKALLQSMNIQRDDYAGREWWESRGFMFFDAPAVIFVMMDEAVKEPRLIFEAGCVTQNICLAAYDRGLGTCAELQAITFQKEARRILHIPDSKKFVMGIAIGYPDESFAPNRVRSTREPVENITAWCGFDE